jgi:RNA polymerase sigma-70 factor (ECF subfamily)
LRHLRIISETARSTPHDKARDEQAAGPAGESPEESLRDIFLRYYRPVYYFFLRRGFLEDESHDLTQETFLRVHKGLPAFRGEARFETWLFEIAANLYRNHLRSLSTLKRDASEVSLDEVLDQGTPEAACHGQEPLWVCAGAGPLEGLLTEERLQVLHAALEELPPQMRRCVLLRIEQDLKYREIADVMNVSIDTVKAHLFQARQQLKGKLAKYFSDLEF